MSVDPHLGTIEKWVSAGIRQVASMTELHEVFPAAYQEVAAAVTAAGAHLIGPAYACYFGPPTDVVDVEIGFGIDQMADVSGVTVTSHPAAEAAIGTHVGPYEGLAGSYAEFTPWLESQQCELRDHMFEFYDSPPDTDPSQTVTRLVFPLA